MRRYAIRKRQGWWRLDTFTNNGYAWSWLRSDFHDDWEDALSMVRLLLAVDNAKIRWRDA